MGLSITHKIIADHLTEGTMVPGEEVAISIDHTLTQDATGTMAYLQFEAMGVPRVRTKRSVSYIDHNTLQNGFENADDHSRICRAWHLSTASTSRGPAMASATRCSWNGLTSPVTRCLVPTVTPPRPAGSACWQ